MYGDKFVLSIIHDGHPVKETGYQGNKVVALPFDSEYKIRLKNKNDRGCTARIFIDDKRVSELGDLIITANGTIDLERFIDSSLDHGKRFKFVSLDHLDVDDPTSSTNGIIKVEFRLARQENGIKINTGPLVWKPWDWTDYKPLDCADMVWYYDNNSSSYKFSTDDSIQVSYCASNFISEDQKNVEDGATVEGKRSNQSFIYSNLDVVDFPTTTLQLKIVGIKDSKHIDKMIYKYCSHCGAKVKRSDKYCFECGSKL